MASFRYKALTAAGTTMSGIIEAPSAADVIGHLRAQGHYPLSAVEGAPPGLAESVRLALGWRSRPSRRSLALITQELASLLGAGIELDRAIAIVAALREAGDYSKSFALIRTRLRDGMSLSEALSQDGGFPAFYVGMVRAGEFGGSLAGSLKSVADYLTRSIAIREAVLSALLYPLILLATSGVSIAVILFFVLPEFKPLFDDAGQTLPLPARILMDISQFILGYWWLIAAVFIGGALWVKRALRSESLRLRIDAWLLRAPLLGPLLQAIVTERFCRVLGMLLAGGVPLPAALVSAKDAVQNRKIAEAIGQTAARLREGESLASRLVRTGLFSAATTDLIAVGEETGNMDEMLLRQAESEEQRVRHVIDRLLTLLVPALTLVMGAIVAGLIATLMTAILSLNQLALG